MQPAYTLQEIQAQVGGQLIQGGVLAPIQTYVFDSRELVTPDGVVFLALKSARRDGHAYIQTLYDAGVRNFWVSQAPPKLPEANFLVVEDVLTSLQALAAYHRQQFTGVVVGITGSNGKTVVKEWLASLLEGHVEVYKSPRSYNSQLGVALALLGLRPQHQVALIECGISQVGEMARLEAMVHPTLGLLTHVGHAHDEGFSSPWEKATEKCALFRSASAVFTHHHNPAFAGAVEQALAALNVPIRRPAPEAITDTGDGIRMLLQLGEETATLETHLSGTASEENLALAATVAHGLGVPMRQLEQQAQSLRQVELRTQLITDNPEVIVLADAYNADTDSLANALALLRNQQLLPHKRIILSDLEQVGAQAESQHRAIVAQLLAVLPEDAIELIGPLFQAVAPGPIRTYPTTEAFLAEFTYGRYRECTVLVKGARRFELEQVLPFLTRHPGPNVLRISLSAAVANLEYLHRQLPTGTGLMVMLKAGAYGTGSWQMAQALSGLPIQAFAVAQTVEGIELRGRGIKTPIVVLYPDPTLQQCISHQLEPVLSGWHHLQALERLPGTATLPHVHLEIDTGMGRLGFLPEEIPEVLHRLGVCPQVQVGSCFAHLAASEDPSADVFTRTQATLFADSAALIRAQYPACKLHLLNTGGMLRFPEYAFDWVRLGIGLFGIDPRGRDYHGLEEIAQLSSAVAQVHTYGTGTSVGYGRAEVLARPSRIATVPLGYADGIPRAAGERRASVLIRQQRVPIVGRICMDMLMVDVTDLDTVQVGDEVVIFGRQGDAFLSIHALAAAAGTIPYEVLSRIPARIRRAYVRE